MKAECARCGASATQALTVVDGAIHATCSACGAIYPVDPPPPPAREAPPAPAPNIPIPPPPPGAEDAYAACEEKWDDADRHDAFLGVCKAQGSFAYAAARYRIASAHPMRAHVAGKRLQQIRTLAEAALVFAMRAEKPLPRPHTLRWVAGAIFAVALVIVLFLFLSRR